MAGILLGVLVMGSAAGCGHTTRSAVGGPTIPIPPASPASIVPDVATGGILDRVLQTGQIRIAVPQDFPPFGSMSTTLTLQGYDIDVARLLAAALQVELVLVPVTSDQRIPMLQSGQVDVLIASLGADEERAKSLYFSKAYAPFYSGIYGTAKISAATYEDLAPYTIGVTGQSLEDKELSQHGPQGLAIERYQTNALTISALLMGQVDAIATSSIVAAQLIRENPNQTIGQKFIMRNSPCYIGIRRGDLDFLQWLNVFVTNNRLGGNLETLSETWFKEPLGELPG